MMMLNLNESKNYFLIFVSNFYRPLIYFEFCFCIDLIKYTLEIVIARIKSIVSLTKGVNKRCFVE